MITGIEAIELLPPFGKPADISNKIQLLFRESTSIKAAIAYWSIEVGLLNQLTDFKAIKILSDPASFLCVDIQRPTNIDYLEELASNGVAIHLHMRRINKNLEKYSDSLALLHTKVLLANKNDQKAEFWVGSHNWTRFALFGLNVEASVSFHLFQKAPLYLNAQTMIERFRDKFCEPFDPNKIEYYKQLQNFYLDSEKAKYVLELEATDAGKLEGEVICIFGTNFEDFQKISTAGVDIFLSIYDSNRPENRYLYQGHICLSSELPSINPVARGIEITEPCRHAFRMGFHFPTLGSRSVIHQSIYEKAYYVVRIEIIKLTHDKYDLTDPPKRKISLWEEAEFDPLYEGEEIVLSQHYDLKHFLESKSFVLVPADSKTAKKGKLQERKLIDQEKTYEEKKLDENHPIVSKKIIRYTR